jgi:hypothetical protein
MMTGISPHMMCPSIELDFVFLIVYDCGVMLLSADSFKKSGLGTDLQSSDGKDDGGEVRTHWLNAKAVRILGWLTPRF